MRARNLFNTSARHQLARPIMGLGVLKSESKAVFGRSSPNKGAYVLGGEHQIESKQSVLGQGSPRNLTINADYNIFKSQQNNDALSKVK